MKINQIEYQIFCLKVTTGLVINDRFSDKKQLFSLHDRLYSCEESTGTHA